MRQFERRGIFFFIIKTISYAELKMLHNLFTISGNQLYRNRKMFADGMPIDSVFMSPVLLCRMNGAKYSEARMLKIDYSKMNRLLCLLIPVIDEYLDNIKSTYFISIQNITSKCFLIAMNHAEIVNITNFHNDYWLFCFLS